MVGKCNYRERICKENKHNSSVLLSYSESKSNVSSEVFWSTVFHVFSFLDLMTVTFIK